MCCCSEDMLGGLGAFLLIVMFHSKMYKVLYKHVLICTYEQTKVQPFFLSNRLQCHQTLYSI